MAKTKVVKAKVTKARQRKRMSKGVEDSWELLAVNFYGYHEHILSESTKREIEDYIKDNPSLLAPIIRHTVIPPMEY